MQCELAIYLCRHLTFELGELADVGGIRKLFGIEEICAHCPGVQCVQTEIDAVEFDGHVDCSTVGGAVEHDGAACLVHLAPPSRNAEVVGFEARIGVCRI